MGKYHARSIFSVILWNLSLFCESESTDINVTLATEVGHSNVCNSYE